MKYLSVLAIVCLISTLGSCQHAGTQEVSDDSVQVDSMLSMDSLEIDTLHQTDTL